MKLVFSLKCNVSNAIMTSTSAKDLVGISSLNCRGLGNKEKRRQVFNFLRNKPSPILFLQETHSTISSEKYWLSEWDFKIIFSHGCAYSRETCIMFKNNFEQEIIKHYCDNNGRFVIVDVISEGKNLTLVSLYATNDDIPEFFDQVFSTLKNF